MSLVTALLSAIVRADGDALVLHTGECPYVVAPSGQTELASRPLSPGWMTGILSDLLSADAREALDELGAVQRDLSPRGFPPDERFTVVAARGGDDIWVEIRRYRRSAGSGEPPPRVAGHQNVVPQVPHSSPHGGMERLLRIAAERGASTLYVTSNGRPCVRIDGKVETLEGEETLDESQVEALILEILPGNNPEMLRSKVGADWIVDTPDVGRIRGTTFRDHRGTGAILRMVPARSISAEHLGLSGEIRALCNEPEGLVLVTGPRESGQSILLAALVHLINTTRSVHVITLEQQINFVHENRSSLVSQREVGGGDLLVAAARAALRETPDVLVVEDLGSPEIVMLALEAARAGRLVLGALTDRTATSAVDRIIEETPPDRRSHVLSSLAASLRGVVAQLLVRKTGGGYVAAREVLMNTGAVSRLIAEGKTSQLQLAIENGGHYGMAAFNDVLASLVLSGVVDAREGYRHAPDKPGFLSLLARSGTDTFDKNTGLMKQA